MPNPRVFLFALDFSGCSLHALEHGIEQLRPQPEDVIHLVALVHPPPADLRHSLRVDFDAHEEEERHMAQLKKLWGAVDAKMKLSQQVGCRMQFTAEVAEPKSRLLELCSETGESAPTMLIMGSHGKEGSARELGSVSDFCVRKAPVPVLVIKEPKS